MTAHTKPKVAQLELYRAERVVSAIRRRLSELQCARVQAELGAGRLLRELAALQRELRDCRARMVQSGVLEWDSDVAGPAPRRIQPRDARTARLQGGD